MTISVEQTVMDGRVIVKFNYVERSECGQICVLFQNLHGVTEINHENHSQNRWPDRVQLNNRRISHFFSNLWLKHANKKTDTWTYPYTVCSHVDRQVESRNMGPALTRVQLIIPFIFAAIIYQLDHLQRRPSTCIGSWLGVRSQNKIFATYFVGFWFYEDI
jgi:hypothetical protein